MKLIFHRFQSPKSCHRMLNLRKILLDKKSITSAFAFGVPPHSPNNNSRKNEGFMKISFLAICDHALQFQYLT